MTRDRSFAPEVMAMNLVPYMRALQDKDVTFTVYPGTGHAFANESNALGTHDDAAAAVAWDRAVAFLKANVPG